MGILRVGKSGGDRAFPKISFANERVDEYGDPRIRPLF